MSLFAVIAVSLIEVSSSGVIAGDGCGQWNSSYDCRYGDPCSWRNAVKQSYSNFDSCNWDSSQGQCEKGTRSRIRNGRSFRPGDNGNSAPTLWNYTKPNGYWLDSESGLVCLPYKDVYYLANFSQYVQPRCADLHTQTDTGKISYFYDTWISLGSQCSKNWVSKPCRSDNTMMVIRGTIRTNRGSYNYYSCWTVASNDFVSFNIDDDGNLVYRIGHIFCCPTGGKPGDRNSMPVDIKLIVGEHGDRVTVDNWENLESCDNNSKPIDVTIEMSSTKYKKTIMMYNYTTPVFKCVVVNTTNSSTLNDTLEDERTTVSMEDIIHCSLNMEISLERARCSLRDSSIYLSLLIKCPDGVVRIRNLDMSMMDANYSMAIYVANVADPGCTIQISGRYLHRFAPESTEIRVEDNEFEVAKTDSTRGRQNSKSKQWIVPTSLSIIGVVVLIILFVLIRFFRSHCQQPPVVFVYDVGLVPAPGNEPTPQATSCVSGIAFGNGHGSEQSVDTKRVVKVSCLFSEKDQWVIKELFPLLESETGIELKKYPLVGKAKTAAIVDQLKGSSKIIIVISHNYLSEEMSEFAITKAQMEVIEKRNDIVPIRLDDSPLPEDINHVSTLDLGSVDFRSRLLEAIYRDK